MGIPAMMLSPGAAGKLVLGPAVDLEFIGVKG